MMRRYVREISVALAFALLLLTLAAAAWGRRGPDATAVGFFTWSQVESLLVKNAPLLLLAVGMTVVIVARQIDISVGAQFSLCGIIAGLLAKAGLPMPAVALAAVLAGGALGALNGVLIAALNLPSIVVTLATWVIMRESLRWWREGEFVRELPADFQWFGLGQAVGQWLIIALALLVFLLWAWGMRYLAGGRAVYATGSDAEAARLAGMRPRRVVFGVFVAMGALAGLAALLNAVRFPQVEPDAGKGLELQAIAAAVVGGTAISGGRGTLAGTFLGVALLGTIGSALVFLGTQPEWEKALQGLIILTAVASDALNRKRR